MSKKQALQELLNKKSSPLTHLSTDKQENVKMEIQEYRNMDGIEENRKIESHTVMKKKATFELDAELHKQLKMYSAKEGKKMVDVVEQALKDYMVGKMT